MVDAVFSHPRLARIYDALDPDRSDLNTYVDVVADVGARVVLDVGCGTGTFLARLVDLGQFDVVGVDPAGASIDVARAKVDPERVDWIVGTVEDVAEDCAWRGHFDLVTMTVNVAQVFLKEIEWLSTLRAIHTSLQPGGHLAFETRVPADRAWKRWTKELTRQVVDVPGEGPVEDWVHVTRVSGAFVTFDSPTIFHADGERIESTSILRFRTDEELRATLTQTGFMNIDIRDLPYAPGRGWLVVANT